MEAKVKTRFIATLMALVIMLGLMPTALAADPWKEVSNFTQFKAALQDAKVTHIRLTKDIHVEKKGVEINEKKAELTIDGAGYKITAHASNAKADTIQLNKAGTLKKILVQNATIQVSNYYGLISVASLSKMNDVVLTFENIEFSGPQLVYAEDSRVTLRNGNFKIVAGYNKTVDELVEATHIRLEGNIEIFKDEKGADEIFRIERKNGGITVASGAIVNVSLNQKIQKKTSSGFVHMQQPGGYIRFEAGSYFNFVGTSFFQQHKDFKEVYIGERAEVYIRTTGNFKGTYGIFMVCGTMTVDRDAILNIICLGNTKCDPVIELSKKTSFICNSPKEVFIFNSSTHKTNKGLAIGPDGCDKIELIYRDVFSVEYWNMNKKPHDDLPAPTYDWRNPPWTAFTATCEIKAKVVNSAKTVGYTGTTPFNTKTAVLKDINVIRINGGTSAAKITYLPGEGGTGGQEPYIDTVALGSSYTIKTKEAVEIDKAFNEFLSWNTEEDGSGDTYNAGQVITVTENLTLHAQWDPWE